MNVKVLSECCDTCVFRPGNLMSLRSGRLKDLVASNRKAGAGLVCHERLDTDSALCRGFYDRFGEETTSIQVYQRLGGKIEEVKP